MITRLKATVRRADAAFAEDLLGVTVLFAVLFLALALPGAV